MLNMKLIIQEIIKSPFVVNDIYCYLLIAIEIYQLLFLECPLIM